VSLTPSTIDWRSAKHAAQGNATLATYAEPVVGAVPVEGVETAFVLKVLEPIWTAKPEMAGRIRGRIEAVHDWAKATAREYRQGENPARWRGHLGKASAGSLQGAEGRCSPA
jgi:hypothetical protein